MLKCGDTIEMPKPGHSVPHLWILITEPDAASGEAVMVNVTTLRSHSDTTVLLKRGDHPYIIHDSVVFYADARIVDCRKIDAGVNAGYFPQLAACSPAVLKTIQEGLLKSPYTPNKVIAYFKARKP